MGQIKLSALGVLIAALSACSAGGGAGERPGNNVGSGATGAGGSGAGGNPLDPGSGGSIVIDPGGPVDPGGGDDDNPTSCEQAAAQRTYIGCDFWPTVTYNPVFDSFPFNVVIANGAGVDANITVERGGAQVATATVPAGSLTAVPLPWVMELKGQEFYRGPTNVGVTSGARQKTSVLVPDGAFHLVSNIPVTVWQFSPLDYQQPAAECPGLPPGTETCKSVSNDASLLLPSTAMTGNYRLAGRSARLEGGGIDWTSSQGAFAITATQDGTMVDIQLSPHRVAEVGAGAQIGAASLAAGTGVAAAAPGDTVSYAMNAGDVLQLVGTWAPFEPEPHGDLSGSIVNASAAVQVIALNPLLNNVPAAPTGNPDHIEETVLPAEVLGNSYIVAPPTGPDQLVPGHMVRFYGNVAGTTLTYPEGMPAGAPVALAEGEVVEIGPVTTTFVVSSGLPFAVASIMIGGTLQDPNHPDPYSGRGDPAISMTVTPEQFRKQYTFLAPTNYIENYADILLRAGTNVTIDGAPLSGSPEPIGASGWSLVRERLADGNNGAHRLESDQPVGLQIMGFGDATSYYYPGGLNLKLIAPPPVIVK